MKKILKMRGICKSFPGVKALDDVQMDVQSGEVHVLLGENGAGKSTLMKILAGVYRADRGTIEIDGRQVQIRNTKEAKQHRVGIIFQEFNLIPHLTVAENIFLGREPRVLRGMVNIKRLIGDAERVLREMNLHHISPRTLVQDLGVAEQQMVEIAKALSTQSRILILDEPTAALTEQEIETLFDKVRDLKAKGVGVIYISHRFEEFPHIADRVTVMRDGCTVSTLNYSETSDEELIRLMVGRNLQNQWRAQGTPSDGKELLRVTNLSTRSRLREVSLHLNSGEILGIAGLMGSGRTELARAIFGADSISGGDIFIRDKKVVIRSPKQAIDHGICYLSEDRKKNGLALNLSVRENITMADMKAISYKSVINRREESAKVQSYIEQLKIKTPSAEQKVKYLSGGNQQKVVIAKWLHSKSQIFIFDEPTRGIDVGAKTEVYELIRQLARRGKAVMVISSEMPELLGLSDRILVMNEGRLTGTLTREQATQEKIMHYATLGI
ncbi:monosaccharide ABC transporter ATP-binding protein, CUT2 family [Kroppenstedtia eburnea]|uniref:Monosaccharide ABC transporter ATP-binding protein, CUT2 family n=2 Tax=Kroppenstedtia eburnea TaxID=714067 RepID=A0A1N7IMB0_9BACL|nr:monosaccharide ABC transporter ATP-binding protein, CUT2 family [Kroppenstedtia eburnea]